MPPQLPGLANQEEVYYALLYAAVGLAFALGFGPAASAADNGWGNASNGNGDYHESNG